MLEYLPVASPSLAWVSPRDAIRALGVVLAVVIVVYTVRDVRRGWIDLVWGTHPLIRRSVEPTTYWAVLLMRVACVAWPVWKLLLMPYAVHS
jgi:hypothetical protein